MKVFQISLIYIIIQLTTAKQEHEDDRSKISLNNFRKQIEEIDNTMKSTEKDESQNNLIEFLVKNVKAIFKDLSESNDITTENIELSMLSLKPNISLSGEDNIISIEPIFTKDVMLYENLSLNALIDNKLDAICDTPAEEICEHNGNDLLRQYNDIIYQDISHIPDHEVASSNSNITNKYTDSVKTVNEHKPSCISCDNVNTEDCSNPINKLIPSIVCERADDLCYSLHTPFGIIDRGCYNVNHNLTTYVCTCNLCNYLSISEMPYIFSNKQDWVDNVVELSRTRHFSKSVFKNMSCLRCEVNGTAKQSDTLESANCLDGTLGMLPTQECKAGEICAVKTIKNKSYMWRGCIKSPLYNYWWAFCDSDLCNYDSLVSIYDFVTVI